MFIYQIFGNNNGSNQQLTNTHSQDLVIHQKNTQYKNLKRIQKRDFGGDTEMEFLDKLEELFPGMDLDCLDNMGDDGYMVISRNKKNNEFGLSVHKSQTFNRGSQKIEITDNRRYTKRGEITNYRKSHQEFMDTDRKLREEYEQLEFNHK